MNTLMTTQFLCILDSCMFHNQKTDQYINRTQKNSVENVNKDHESSFNRIFTVRQQF